MLIVKIIKKINLKVESCTGNPKREFLLFRLTGANIDITIVDIATNVVNLYRYMVFPVSLGNR